MISRASAAFDVVFICNFSSASPTGWHLVTMMIARLDRRAILILQLGINLAHQQLNIF